MVVTMAITITGIITTAMEEVQDLDWR
jgi:hypothetical protein